MAALYLACKVEDQPRQFEDIRETFLQTALTCHGVAYAAVNHEVLHPVYSPRSLPNTQPLTSWSSHQATNLR